MKNQKSEKQKRQDVNKESSKKPPAPQVNTGDASKGKEKDISRWEGEGGNVREIQLERQRRQDRPQRTG
ncbi:MAG TPA: hypothetical protein VL588_09170 [Bdellovibrionota bacterium]|jgi:hypothetical protein|nr:hypothetical protein [Bdellovibrionota bacterium]